MRDVFEFRVMCHNSSQILNFGFSKPGCMLSIIPVLKKNVCKEGREVAGPEKVLAGVWGNEGDDYCKS